MELFDPDALTASTPETQQQDELLQGSREMTHAPEPQTLEALYDENQKLVFLFDISGSMNNMLAERSEVPEMADVRWYVADSDFHRVIIDALRGQLSLNDREALGKTLQLAPTSMNWDGTPMYAVNDQEEAMIRSLDVSLLKTMLLATRNWMLAGEYRDPMTRIKMCKMLAQEQVTKRLQKYPNADIEILVFDTATHRMRGETVMENLESFQAQCIGGLTDIGRAVKDALALCRKAPSAVGLHHLVLVSDAGQNAGNIDEDGILKQMLQLGVVFDMILMGNADGRWADAFKMWAHKTGGEFELVRSPGEFRQKFLAATERKCLPPASAK